MAALGRTVMLALVFILGQVATTSRVKFNILNKNAPQQSHATDAHSGVDESEAKAVVSEHRQSTDFSTLNTPKVTAATDELHSSQLHITADQEESGNANALAETSSSSSSSSHAAAHSEADSQKQQQAKVGGNTSTLGHDTHSTDETTRSTSKSGNMPAVEANKSISAMGSMPAMALQHFRSMLNEGSTTAELIVLSVVLAFFFCVCCVCFTGFEAARFGDSISENGRNQYTSKNRVIYEWDQTPEVLTMYTKPPPGITKHNIEVLLWSKHISIGRKEKPAFLKEELWAEIDLDRSTWGISRAGELEIRFRKQQEAQWPCVIKAHLGGKRSAKTPSLAPSYPRKTTA